MASYKSDVGPFRAALSPLLATIETLRHRLTRARLRIAAGRTLRGLDDATLRDLGLHRTEIDAVVAEAFGDTQRSHLRLESRRQRELRCRRTRGA